MIHLLHGAVGDARDWDAFIPLLAGHACQAVDLYGEDVLPLDAMGDRLCSGAGAGDVLIGYSMGGRLAMHALVRPDRPWSKAVIISADPGRGVDQARLARDAEWAVKARGDWSQFCQEWTAQPILAGAAMPRGREGASEERREAVARGFEEWSVGRQRDLREELASLELPQLWVVGAEDPKFVGLAEDAVTRLRHGRLEVVADAGHRVPWERTEAVAAAIRSFLS